MLEANPALTPALVREILFTTAQRLPLDPVVRQGYGMIDAKSCVEKAQREQHMFLADYAHSPFIDQRNHKIVFFYHDHDAKKVMLVGDFNDWSLPGYLFTAEEDGRWRCEVPLFPEGEYRYKFVVNDSKWISDPRNPFAETDGFNGLNSKFMIE
jgi:hypothetical protein